MERRGDGDVGASLLPFLAAYNRHFPLVPVQRQSNELPATTVGECRRRHSLRRHKGGRWDCPFNFPPPRVAGWVFQVSGAFCVEAGKVPAQTHEDCGGSSGHGSAPSGASNTTLRAGSPWWSSGGTTRIKRATPAERPTHNLAGTIPRNGSDDTVQWPMGHVVIGVRTSGVAGMPGPWSPRTDGQPPAGDRPEERRAPTQRLVGTNPKTGRPYLLTRSGSTT